MGFCAAGVHLRRIYIVDLSHKLNFFLRRTSSSLVKKKKKDGCGSLSSILKQLGTVGFSTLLKHYFQLCLNTHCTNEYLEQQVHVLFLFMMTAHVTK